LKEDNTHFILRNILINKFTIFDDYNNQIKNNIYHIYDLAYQGDIIPMLKVIVWNMDLICNKKIKFNISSIIISNKSSYLITPYSSLPNPFMH
jgi:hypothetical protein